MGSLSGLVGTVLMTQFQNMWNKASQSAKPQQQEDKSKQSEQEDEDSTMKTAGKIAEAAGHELSRDQRKKGGLWVHYGYGTIIGGIFGLIRESAPQSLRRVNPVLSGAGYGTAAFIGGHELAVPALKLSGNPLKVPPADQAAEFFAHLIYGVGTALTYELVRKV